MKPIRDNIEFLESLGPIIAEPRSPSTPLWEMTILCKQLFQVLSLWEKEGNTMPKTFEMESALETKDFKAFLELLEFNVAEVTEEVITGTVYHKYHVELSN